MDLNHIYSEIKTGKRITREQAELLYKNANLPELGILANLWRQKYNPSQIVSYLIDRNINYTNVCNTDCTFCGFYRPNSKHPESYVNSKEVIGQKIEEALALGATRILLQGGHNPDLKFDFYLDLISWIHKNYKIEINSFSPSEIHQMHLVSGKSYHQVLSALQEAGMRGLPGGGAEILDDDIRKRVSPKKISADLWISIMEVAHSLGLTTTATMVIGFGETLAQRLNHLDRLRDAQDRSLSKGYQGFNAFISWPLQHNENTSMGRSRHASNYGASDLEYLKNLALSRVYLDNIPHHQASWPSCGPAVAQIGLHFGCDDIGSTMIEENVVSQAGGHTEVECLMTPEQLQNLIRQAGFTPAQRNSSFEILRVHE